MSSESSDGRDQGAGGWTVGKSGRMWFPRLIKHLASWVDKLDSIVLDEDQILLKGKEREESECSPAQDCEKQ